MSGTRSGIEISDRILTRMKLKQLRLVIAICDHASLLHAAKVLSISQPTATKLLQDLEIDLGVTLFERTNRGAFPTSYGTALIRHGRLVLAQLSHAAQELDDLVEGTGGRIVVGTLLAASAIILPATIARIREQRPNVSIAVTEGTNERLIPALHDGKLDLVVGRLPQYRYRQDLVQEPLYDEPMCVVARSGHTLAKQDAVTPEAILSAREWILPPPDTTLRRQIDKLFHDQGVAPPANPLESISYLTNRYLIVNTDMIGVWPYHVVQDDIERGLLRVLPIEVSDTSQPVGVCLRSEEGLSPAAQAFLACLRKTASDMVAQGIL